MSKIIKNKYTRNTNKNNSMELILRNRIWFAKNILLTTYWYWDAEKQSLKYSAVSNGHYLEWNCFFILVMAAVYIIILTSHLAAVLLYESEVLTGPKNAARFTMYVVGIAENSIISLVVFVSVWQRRGRHRHYKIVNQLLYDTKKIKTILQKKKETNFEDVKKIYWFYISHSAFLLGMCLLTPFLVVYLLCLPYDESHYLIQEYLEINLSICWQHLPLLFLIFWVANSGASVAFEGVFMGLLYCGSADIWIYSLNPIMIKPNFDKLTNKLVHTIDSKKLGSLSENEFVLHWRSIQITNAIFNEAVASILISCHHLLCLVTFVGSSFILIRMPDKIIEGGIFTLLIFVAGSFLILYTIYFESSRFGMVVDISEEFLQITRKHVLRRTALFKVMRSCKALDVKLAYPFFRVSKQTFPEFFDQGVSFIVTLLTT